MNITRALAIICLGHAVAGCTLDPLEPDFERTEAQVPKLPSRIAFGSCSDPTLPMPLLDVATSLDPEVYLWLGDNVYADTTDEQVMRNKYAQLANSAEFNRINDQAQLLATWDDHDYGANDAGKEYPMRAISRDIFLEFWQEPAQSERRDHDGIYTSYRYEDQGNVLQIIALDTRYNRDLLTLNDGSGKNDYMPNQDPAHALLGEAQWAWLEKQLQQAADLRIVISSIQFAHEYNGWESWTLFPHERQRFVDLIKSTEAHGVVLLSGDVHWGEVSQLTVPGGYDLYDVTSSGINQDWPAVDGNNNRIGEAVPEHNVGLLVIDWSAASLVATLYDVNGAARTELALNFAQLSP